MAAPTTSRSVAASDRRLPACAIRLHDEFGVPGDAREATAWAVLADETMLGNPATLPRVTGASGTAVLGKIVAALPVRPPLPHPGRADGGLA